jgi:hypothetical protein
MSAITINGNTFSDKKIQTRWNGQHLAVHAVVIDKGDYIAPAGKNDATIFPRWMVTHKNTGFKAAAFNNLKKAIYAARIADSSFGYRTKEEAQADTEFVANWKNFVRELDGIVG